MAARKKSRSRKSVASRIKESLQQYSKKMCTRVTVFWMLYRVIVLVVVFFKPDVSNAIIRLTEGVDTAMIINMSVYTANSTVEKVSLAYFGKKFKDTLEESDEDTKQAEDYVDEVVEEGIQNG